jgi:DegV family protein with EDD domain
VVKANREKFELDYLKMVFTIEDKEYDADLDWQEIPADDYYNKMRQGNRAITGLVKTAEFEEKFTKALEAGLDILYVACSSRLSGSCNNGNLIAKELMEKYPDRKIVCFDSLRSNYSEGMIALDGAKMALEGKSLDETVAYLEENRLKYQTYATVATLDWLKKAGRVKASTAFFGNLFGVKPIIVSDAAGNNYGYKKMKGRKNSLDELIATVAARIENPAQATVYVEHADCLNDAEYIANAIKAKVNPKAVEISYLGPIIGASVGPDALTVSFYGEKVTVVSGD